MKLCDEIISFREQFSFCIAATVCAIERKTHRERKREKRRYGMGLEFRAAT